MCDRRPTPWPSPKNLNIPKRNIELQVLYGMADKLAKTLADKGFRVRVYTPFGELIPGMSYLIRRLLENTANSSFPATEPGRCAPLKHCWPHRNLRQQTNIPRQTGSHRFRMRRIRTMPLPTSVPKPRRR
jgi:hypothetical protein